jgi:hypothetical protein
MPSQSYSVYDSVALLPDWAQMRRRTPFTFGVDFVALGANAVASQDVKISDDADFVLCYQTAVCTSDAGQATFVTTVPWMVTITDGGSGRLNMNQAIHFGNIFGRTEYGPIVVPQPQVLVRSSTYTVSVTNLTATATFTARLAFWGFKMYGQPLQAGTY